MKLNWNGSGRKVTYSKGRHIPLILEWQHLGSESIYVLRLAESVADVDGEALPYRPADRLLLFLRIPDNDWQDTTPKIYSDPA